LKNWRIKVLIEKIEAKQNNRVNYDLAESRFLTNYIVQPFKAGLFGYTFYFVLLFLVKFVVNYKISSPLGLIDRQLLLLSLIGFCFTFTIVILLKIRK